MRNTTLNPASISVLRGALLCLLTVVVACFSGGIDPDPSTDTLLPARRPSVPTTFPSALTPVSDKGDSIREPRIAPRRWAIVNAPPCARFHSADTANWKTEKWGRRSIKLPADFLRDPNWKSYHGGVQWRQEHHTVALEDGWWGVDLSGGSLNACRLSAPAGDFIVQEKSSDAGLTITAMPADSSWRLSTRIVVSGRPDNLARFAFTLLQTYAYSR